MKQNGVFVSVLMLLALVLTACVPVQAAEMQDTATTGLSWPDHKGRQEIVYFDHDNYCASSSECLFFGSYAFENVAVGDATLSVERIDGLGVLRVDGIDSTLTNGVLQYMPETTVMETFLLVPNFSLSSEGATLKTTQVGIVDGEPDQEFSAMWITNVGEQLKIEGDWSYIEPESYEIQIFQGTKLVASETGLKSGEMFVPLVDVLGQDCEIKPPHKLTGEVTTTTLFTIPGRGEFEGDAFAIIPENNVRIPEAQTEIVMLAKDTGPLHIVQQYAGVDHTGLLELEAASK